jgi:hypothetical protein
MYHWLKTPQIPTVAMDHITEAKTTSPLLCVCILFAISLVRPSFPASCLFFQLKKKAHTPALYWAREVNANRTCARSTASFTVLARNGAKTSTKTNTGITTCMIGVTRFTLRFNSLARRLSFENSKPIWTRIS